MIFQYKALDSEGKDVSGKIEASSHDAALKLLAEKKLTIFNIEQEEEKNILNVDFFANKVSVKDLVIFTQQLTTLLGAGITPLRAFNILSTNVSNKSFGIVLSEIAESVKKGRRIANAMEDYPDIFSNLYINMVSSGEESGTLVQSLGNLSEYIQRNYEINARIKGAVTYPAFVIVVFFGVLFLMLGFVIPSISTILEGQKEIPAITEVVIGLSTVVQQHWITILILTGAFIAGGWWYFTTDTGSRALDRAVLRVPGVRKLFTFLYLARFTQNVGLMLKSGVPLLRVVEVTGSVINNSIYEEIFKDVGRELKNGRPFSEALSDHKEITELIVSMARIGEETGKTPEMFEETSKFYKDELDRIVGQSIKLIEPMLIIVLGIVISVLIASVLLPIYTLTSQL